MAYLSVLGLGHMPGVPGPDPGIHVALTGNFFGAEAAKDNAGLIEIAGSSAHYR